MKKHGPLKIFMVYQCNLTKLNPEGVEERNYVYFHSRNRRLLSIDEFEEYFEDVIGEINEKLGQYMGEASGWIMDSITSVNLHIARYNPIR